MRKYLLMCYRNLLIILLFLSFSYFLFGGFISDSVSMYQKIGIGMIAIAPNSFYWYVPVILCVLSYLLLKHNDKISDKYFTSGLFLVLLTIGNSMYFFGRSHEHNIINITSILSLALFFWLAFIG